MFITRISLFFIGFFLHRVFPWLFDVRLLNTLVVLTNNGFALSAGGYTVPEIYYLCYAGVLTSF